MFLGNKIYLLHKLFTNVLGSHVDYGGIYDPHVMLNHSPYQPCVVRHWGAQWGLLLKTLNVKVFFIHYVKTFSCLPPLCLNCQRLPAHLLHRFHCHWKQMSLCLTRCQTQNPLQVSLQPRKWIHYSKHYFGFQKLVDALNFLQD